MDETSTLTALPPWTRITSHPLFTMIVALALVGFAMGLAELSSKFLPTVTGNVKAVEKAVLEFAFVMAAYKLVIRRLGRHPKDDFPLALALPKFGQGVLLGLLIVTSFVAVAALLHIYKITGAGGTGALLSSTLGLALMPGFREELVFRGILFRWLEEFGGSWLALALTSILFGLAHLRNPNATLLSASAIALEAGVLLGAAYMLTRSLWMPIGMHAAWNFTEGEVFDVPVSGISQHGLVIAKLSGPDWITGGAFGLEASLIAMAIATCFGMSLLIRAVRGGKLVKPQWWVHAQHSQQ